MISVLVGLIAVGAVGIVMSVGSPETYRSSLERYINSKNPTNTYDVDRLTREFEKNSARWFL